MPIRKDITVNIIAQKVKLSVPKKYQIFFNISTPYPWKSHFLDVVAVTCNNC